MFDFPEPLGPTTAVTPCSNTKVVGAANGLKPLRVRLVNAFSHSSLIVLNLLTDRSV